MKLIYKLNLVAVGYCSVGAVVLAIAGKLTQALLCVVLAAFNWYCASLADKEE